jgi:hypothetical protein
MMQIGRNMRSMVVARGCTHAIALAVACAVLCPPALAADEEAPSTGTIEVEVVYKDTGEPVEGAPIWVSDREAARTDPFGRASVEVASRDEPYEVTLRHEGRQSRFMPLADSESTQSVHVTAEQPTARVTYQVERGWHLSGTLRNQDGSPLKGMYVEVLWTDPDRPLPDGVWAELLRHQPPEGCAGGRTDPDGRFDVGGLPAGERSVRIRAISQWSSFLWALPLQSQDVQLRSPGTSVDLVAATSVVHLELRTVRPLWPFGWKRSEVGCELHVEPLDQPPLVRMTGPIGGFLYCRQRLELRRVALRRYTSEWSFGPLPVGESMGIGIELRRTVSASGPGGASVVLSHETLLSTKRQIHLGSAAQHELVVLYEPYALVSRLFWFGIVPAAVLAVCAPILVRHVRRRKQESATERHG